MSINSLLLIILVPLLTGKAAHNQWINFTSFKDVRRMRVINDTLFMATSGGILAATDFNQPGKKFVNLDGLGTNDITDIIEDTTGQKLVTGFGRLIKFNDIGSKQFLFFDSDDNLFSLHRVVDDGDNLWIGTEIGLVLFSKTVDNGQIQDSYQLFGNLNPSPIVYDILLSGDSIWLATSSGLAVAVRSNLSLLKSPSNWTVFSLGNHPELSTDTILNVVSFESDIFVGTASNLFLFDATDTTGGTTFVSIPYGNGVTKNSLTIDNDTLFLYYNDSLGGGISFYKDSAISTIVTSGLSSYPLTGIGYKNNRWIAVSKGGVLYDTGGTFVEYEFTGLPGNDISDITINQDGIITAGFRNVAAATFTDSIWNSYSFWIREGITDIVTDSSGNPWIGTQGNGLWFANNGILKNYDENNSSMRGNSDNPPVGETFVLIHGLATDGNFIYAACFRAVNGYPVAIADLNNLDDLSGWDSIGVTHGLTNTFIVAIDYHNGSLAVASEADGVYICDVGNNPFETSISCQHFTRENSLLISNTARVVKFSPDGILWVGTNFGLSRYDSGIDRFVDVALTSDISSDITDLEFDSRGNLWIGTKDGLARLDATTGELEVFNTINSDIVSDVINNITFDKFTGNIYTATNSGFTLIPSDIGKPTYDVNEVIVFPNPFIINNGNDVLRFNFGKNGRVQIANVAGELIRELSINTPWDGRNREGNDVASGVYIYIVTDDNGNISRGKFLLIRE